MSNVVFACTAPSMAFFRILSVYCALGFGLGRFCVSKRALRARGSGFFRFAPSRARGILSFSPLCRPLRGDFRAFPAGVIPFPALPTQAGFPALCGAMPPIPEKAGYSMPLYRVGTGHLKYSLVRVGVEHPPHPGTLSECL